MSGFMFVFRKKQYIIHSYVVLREEKTNRRELQGKFLRMWDSVICTGSWSIKVPNTCMISKNNEELLQADN